MRIYTVSISQADQQADLMSKLNNARIETIQTGAGLALKADMPPERLCALLEWPDLALKELTTEDLANASADLKAFAHL